MLDDDATVVEHAKARRTVTTGMVQPGNRHEGAFCLAVHQPVRGIKHRAGHRGCSLEHADKRRCIALIEKALAGFRQLLDPFDIILGMKTTDCCRLRHHRRHDVHMLQQAAPLGLGPKGSHAIRPEGVVVAEAVCGQRIPEIEQRRIWL